MKTLVIYYSLTGNTKFIAKEIAVELCADIMQLELKNETVKPSDLNLIKYFWGGRQVFMKDTPELLPLAKNLSDYDLLIIGTPVWAWTFSPAMRSFFEQNKISSKKIALFCTHGGGMKKTLEAMEKKLSKNEIVGKIDFKEPLKYGKNEAAKKAREWASQLVKNLL